MPLVIPNTFVPLTTILSSATNTNYTSISNWANAHEIATTGVHGVGAGSIVGTANVNAFINNNSFGAPVTFTNGISTNSPNFISNARLTLTAGTLSLASISGGGAPSATNPVYFTYPTSDGSWQTVTFTSTTYCTIRDTTAGTDMNGMNLGTTAGVAWGDVMPLFIYLVSDGVNPCLFLSRFPFPQSGVTPTSTALGYQGNVPASNLVRNMIGMTANNITVTHASKDALLIGFVQATKSAANAWTFSSLAGSYGIGNLDKIFSTNFNFPTGQNGAATGEYFSTGGGTRPSYTGTSTYTYRISREGAINCNITLSNTVGGVAGVGAVSLQLINPIQSTLSTFRAPNALYVYNGANAIRCNVNIIGNVCQIAYNYSVAAGASIGNFYTGIIENIDQSNVTRGIVGNLIYNLY